MFTILAVLLGSVLLLNVVGTWLNRVRKEVESVNKLTDSEFSTVVSPDTQETNLPPTPLADTPESVPPENVSRNSVPEEETAGYWARQVLTPAGILGALALLLQPVIVPINVYVLSQTFVVIFDVIPQPLATVPLPGGWQHDLTLFDLFGFLISLGQLVMAAVSGQGLLLRRIPAWLTSVALTSWLVLAAFEFATSFYRAFLTGTEESTTAAVLGGGVALGVVLVEGVAGILAFDYFVVPLLLAFLWWAGTPIRGLARLINRFAIRDQSREDRSKSARQTRRQAGAFKSALASLDAVLFQPLRDLDAAVYDPLMGRLLRNQSASRR